MGPSARLDLRLALVLLAVWMAATSVVVLFHLPFWLAKLALGGCAIGWAAHVVMVARRNARRGGP